MRFKMLSLVLMFVGAFMLLSSPATFGGRPIGDLNDDGVVNLGDAVFIISFLYRSGPAPDPIDVADCNGDRIVNLGDAVYLISYLYRDGIPPGNGTGMLYGYVTYETCYGGVVGAVVEANGHADTTEEENQCTGYYVIKNLDPGSYDMIAGDPDDPNCVPQVANGVMIVADPDQPGEMTRQDFILPPGITITIMGTEHCVLCGPSVTGNFGIPHMYLAPNRLTRGCHKYVLDGPCWVCDGDTLKIDPGVILYARPGGDPPDITYLAVQRGGKIEADGEACKPIVFTSNAPVGERLGGDWGGLMLFGKAEMNVDCGFAEGDAGYFGCECDSCNPEYLCDNEDNIGVLGYVRVEFAGRAIVLDNELNGIAMYGVGNGDYAGAKNKQLPAIHHIQVHRNYDDGIEWFGGTVDAKYILISECWDDHFDWTDGARFRAQYVALRGYGGDLDPVGPWGDRMIEADNQEHDFYLLPRSQPTIANITIVGGKEVGAIRNAAGGGSPEPTANSQNMKLRHGTAGRIYNLICMDATAEGFDNQHTNKHAWTGADNQHWPYAPDSSGIDRTVFDVDYALWYNNGFEAIGDPKNGLIHWKDRHSTWCVTQPTSDSMYFDAVCMCDPNLPHTADAWSAVGLYTSSCYYRLDPGMHVNLADDNTGMYDPLLIGPRRCTELGHGIPDFRPLDGSPALNPADAMNPSVLDPTFFDPAQYLGAFEVGDPANHDNDWTYPWAAWPDN